MAPRDDAVELLQALAVTAELTGTELSEPAARVMANDLAAYPVQQVLGALTRCRRELKGRLTVAAILERLDDGRPGPNEAWAMIPQDEAVNGNPTFPRYGNRKFPTLVTLRPLRYERGRPSTSLSVGTSCRGC